jgi:hypothetical protein
LKKLWKGLWLRLLVWIFLKRFIGVFFLILLTLQRESRSLKKLKTISKSSSPPNPTLTKDGLNLPKWKRNVGIKMLALISSWKASNLIHSVKICLLKRWRLRKNFWTTPKSEKWFKTSKKNLIKILKRHGESFLKELCLKEGVGIERKREINSIMYSRNAKTMDQCLLKLPSMKSERMILPRQLRSVKLV